jgi:hypothetical protein
MSESGKVKVATLSTSWRTWSLTFERISTSNFNDLVTFIVNTVRYGELTFQYTDHDATVVTVRYVGSELNFSQVAGSGLFSGTINLKEEL